ncbi:MAG TPA: hypothetical protein VGW75_02795 [Solirubrobacteraceae bacterium]|nr:hypothetical protein [Solirubrobacteraceae bacterium]
MTTHVTVRYTRALAALAIATVALVAGGGATASANVCADANGGYFGRWLQPNHAMPINELTYLSSMDATKVRARLMDAADTWNREINTCGYSTSLSHTIALAPGAFASAQDRADGDRFNGRNQIAFGPIRGIQWARFGCDGGVLACAPYHRGANGYFDETDVQFDTNYNWWGGRETTVPGNAHDIYVPEGWYDLWGIGAHELGHTLGQAHATNAGNNLTMRPQFCSGTNDAACAPYGGPSSNARTLGLGDIHWYRQNYRRSGP